MSSSRPDHDLLADLDAGVLDEGTARAVRAAAEADPAARAVLDALAATRADLAALPGPPVPPEVAARWSAALREAAQRDATQRDATQLQAAQPPAADPDAPTTNAPSTPPTPLPEGHLHATTLHEGGLSATPRHPDTGRATPADPADRPRPSRGARGRRRAAPHEGRPPRDSPRPLGRRPAVLAAAVLLVVLALAAVFGRGRAEVAADSTTLVQQAEQSRGLHDTGAFEDPARRASCLAAVRPPGVPPSAPLLGGRQVTFEGRDGVLLLLGTGRIGQLDVVVVDPTCSALLATSRIGG